MISIFFSLFAKPLLVRPLLLIAFRHIETQIRRRRRWRPRLRMRSRRLPDRALISHIRLMTRTLTLAASENVRHLLVELLDIFLIPLPLFVFLLLTQRHSTSLMSRPIGCARRARRSRGETLEGGSERV